tara:strand:+ start:5064 stop:6056 length:993 start_codon:yes stop_codon:yes gene_type:complete
MRLITLEDFRDLYLKTLQRGFDFILSKFSLKKSARTKSSFNTVDIQASNWWMIPEVKKRWNKLITGNPNTTYEEFISNGIFANSKPLKFLSIGSGLCTHEISLAELNPHWEILCVDFSGNLLEKATKNAKNKNLENIKFRVEDIYTSKLPNDYFDIVFFHSSLHHFKNLKEFIPNKVVSKLVKNGKLIINEYVGPDRIQYPKSQLKAINKCISLIDGDYKTMFKSNLKKNKYYGSGLIRMILSDPSECVDSENILPAIYKHFDVVIEKPYGGSVLMSALKDVAHHFIEIDDRKFKNLNLMFNFEDNYLKENESDFLFGIYQKKKIKKTKK